jgi:hypothetical protein
MSRDRLRQGEEHVGEEHGEDTSMMKKLKAAGLLAALALAAVTLLTSIPASGDGGFLITSMVTRIKRFCAPGEFREACRYLANVIVPATPILPYIQNPQGPPIPADKLAAFLPVAATRMAPVVSPERTCDGCVESVSDLEALLATNGTVQVIADMMDDACTARFRNDTASAQQCAGEIHSTLPGLIDLLLANLPPVTACSAGTRRPMNLCAQ